MSKRKSTEQFIKEAKEKHGNKYNYSLVNYTNSHTNIKILCNIHGLFEQKPYSHLNGNGCKKCADINNGYNKRLNIDDFIIKGNQLHDDKYNYSLVEYKTMNDKVKIQCDKHGIFEQKASSHVLNGYGCPYCANNIKKSTEQFIKEAKEIHGDKYNYNLVDYKNNKIKIKILCNIHGVFEQIPNDHLNSCGCPHCNESKGELKTSDILNEYNISYIKQKTFDKCKYKRNLYFDFYLPDSNTCIEYDGIQHFKKYNFEKNNLKLKIRQKRDKIKTQYCIDNNIHLIRISYKDDIKSVLRKNGVI